MAKKFKEKKEKTINKEIVEKKYKEVKEIISHKEKPSLKKEQIIKLKTTQKTPQIIQEETAQKSPENTPVIEETPTPEINTADLVNVLKIPMQESREEIETHSEIKEAIFNDEPSETEEEKVEEESENLNDRYFKDDTDSDDFDNTFFDDEELMSEMAVEVIDLGMQYLAMGIAQDFENPEKYQVSEYKKKKIKKPLTLLLRKRGTKVSPEIMFGVVLLVVYSPMLIIAIQERKAKQKSKQENIKKKRDVANNIPPQIIEVDHEEILKRRRSQSQEQETPEITPMIIPEEKPQKSKGRPKGSKDKTKRSIKGYKGNKNAQ